MPRDRVTFQHRLEYLAWVAFRAGLRLTPRPAQIRLADALGWAGYHVLRFRRAHIDAHLEIALGATHTPAQRRLIGQRSLQNSILTFFEFVQPNPVGSAGWDDFCAEQGFDEYIRPLLAAGKTGLIITGHIGNWEVMGGLGRREGVPLAGVAKPMHNALINGTILTERRARGLEVLQIQANMKPIATAAKQGKWVAFVGDQDARRSGLFLSFFGRMASTAAGPATFALLMKLPLIPVFCVRLRQPGRPLQLIVLPPIAPDPSAPKEVEIARITFEHTRALEEVVREYPENYFWLHRRWKTQPRRRKGADGGIEYLEKTVLDEHGRNLSLPAPTPSPEREN